MNEKEVQQEIKKAKEEVAKDNYSGDSWRFILPIIMLAFAAPFGGSENSSCNSGNEDIADGESDGKILAKFSKVAKEKFDEFFEKMEGDEFNKFLIHTLATEIEEIKKKQASVENCIAALQSTVQYIMFPQRPYMPSYMPFYIPTPPYSCTQNTETQSQDVNDKSEKET